VVPTREETTIEENTRLETNLEKKQEKYEKIKKLLWGRTKLIIS